MVLEIKNITPDDLQLLLQQTRLAQQRPKKTLADIYGKLKRGIDGLEYQREMRNGFDNARQYTAMQRYFK